MSERQTQASTDETGAARAGQPAAAAAAGSGASQGPKGGKAGTPVPPKPLKDEGGVAGEDVNLEVVLDIPVTLSMEIGRAKLPIRNLLQLNQGSVVELERMVGEPMDVLVNGTLIAHGEVVVVNEKYGIRLTDVISPAERVRKLR